MQYILTREEFINLVPIENINVRDEALNWCFKFIFEHYDLPCKIRKGSCLDCPLCETARITKSVKDRPSDEQSALICTRVRKYPK